MEFECCHALEEEFNWCAPLIRVLASYYVPQTDYSITADIAQPENRTHVQTSTLLSLNQSDHTVTVRFSIFSELDDLYSVTIQAPGQWNITGLQDDTGTALSYHETIDEMGIRRLHAKFPGRKAFGRLHSVLLTAERVPPGWLNQWQEFHLAVPKFMMENTFRNEGVIAIRTQTGFEQVYEIRAEQVSGVEILATAEKQEAGLSGRLALAFRYEKPQYTVAVVARRVKPVMAARLATFLNVQVGVLHTYSEINYTVQQSLVEQVKFVLPGLAHIAMDTRTNAEIRTAMFSSCGSTADQVVRHLLNDQEFLTRPRRTTQRACYNR